jgi:predicted secreted protein
MNLTGGIVLFASIWWLTLFVVLPIGQRSQADAGEVVAGTHAGAPSTLAWRRKLLITTGVTAAIWGVIAFIILGDYITRADITYLDQLIR